MTKNNMEWIATEQISRKMVKRTPLNRSNHRFCSFIFSSPFQSFQLLPIAHSLAPIVFRSAVNRKYLQYSVICLIYYTLYNVVIAVATVRCHPLFEYFDHVRRCMISINDLSATPTIKSLSTAIFFKRHFGFFSSKMVRYQKQQLQIE